MFGSGSSCVWYFSCGTNIGAEIIVQYDPVKLPPFLTITVVKNVTNERIQVGA
jgi:hypothetical protein